MVGGTEALFGTTLRANSGITVSAGITAGGLLSLNSDFDNNGGSLQIDAALASNGAMTLQGGSITSNAGGTLTTQNDPITITSTGAIDMIASVASNGGSIGITSGSTLDLGAGALSSSGGEVVLESVNTMNLFGPLTTSGGSFTARVLGAGNLALQNDVTTSGGNVTMTTVNGTLSSSAGSDINASGGAGTASVLVQSSNAASSVSLSGGVTGGSGGTQILSGNSITLGATVNAGGGSLTLTADSDTNSTGTLTVNAPVQVTGSGNLTLGGATFAQAGTGTLSTAGGTINGTFQTSVTFSRTVSSTSGQIQFKANSGITVSAGITAGGLLSLNSDFDNNGGSLQIDAALASNGAMTLQGGSITSNAGGTLTTQNDPITITSTGAIDMIASVASNGGSIGITSGSTLDLGAGALSSSGGEVVLESVNTMNLFGPLTTSGGSFTARVLGAGNLALQNDVTTSGGNVEMTTANGLLSSVAGSDVNATGGAGTSLVKLESLNGSQNMSLAGSVSGGSGGLILRAGNHLTLASVSVAGGNLELAADTNNGGIGDLTLNAAVSTTGSGSMTLTGRNFVQAGTGTLTTAGGAINGTLQANVTFSRTVSSNGGQIRFSGNAITVSALLSTAPPTGGTGVLHASSAVVINTQPTLGNADIILLAGTVTTPVVTTPTLNAFTTNSAVLGGNVTGAGNLTILERGVVIAQTAVNANPEIGGAGTSKFATTGTLGVFTIPISALFPNTGYTFRAYARNILGTSYTTPATNFNTSATLTGLTDGYDAGLNGGPGSRVACIAVQPDGKALMGGSFSAAYATPRGNLARFNTNATVDSFVANTDNPVECVLVQPDGKILIGGTFSSVNGTTRGGFARLNADGSVESTSTFNPGTGANGSVFAMALQPDGKILIAGAFSSVNGQARSRIARLNADGSVESTTTFNPGTGVTGGVAVFALALQSDGKIVLGGSFTTVNGSARSNLARLNSNGSLEGTGTFNPGSGPAGQVNALLVQPDGKILVGGDFLTFNSSARVRIARLNSNGSLEGTGTFNPGTGVDGPINTLALQADGKILMGGTFANVNGQSRSRLARLQANGNLESLTTFNIGTGPNGSVEALALQADGRILIGGDFSQVNGSSRALQARLNNDAISVALSAPNASTVRLLRGGAAPEIEAPRIELSTDSGGSWSLLGTASRISGGWELTGQSLPATGQLRASAGSRSGRGSGSASWIVATQGFGLPRLAVKGLGQPVSNGDTSISDANGTDLRTVLTAGVFASEQTFTIENSGGDTLNLTGSPRVALTGPQAADFRITQQPATASVSVGSSTTFSLRFNPSAPGPREVTVSIASNDATASPFTFVVGGIGTLSSPLAQSIVLKTPASVLVNEGPVPLDVYATSSLPVNLTVLSGPANIAGPYLIPNGVGIVKIQATQLGNAIYRPAKPVFRTIIVRDAPTTPTLAELRHLYDGTPRSASVRGNIDGPVFTYRVDGADTANAPSNAGTYPVTAEVDGRVLKGQLVILKLPLYTTPNDVRRFVGQPNPAFTLSYDGFIVGDDPLNVFAVPGARAPQVSTRAKTSSPGGLYPIIASRGVLRNYQFVYLPGYLTVETFAGKYEALLTDIGSSEALGKVELTVASNNTSFSGRVTWGEEAASFPIAGNLTSLPQETLEGLSAEVVRGANRYVVGFQLPFDRDCSIHLFRNALPNAIASAINGQRIYAPPSGQKVAFAGRHTFLLNPGTPQGTGVPAGHGQAIATVDSIGGLRLSGKLADGRPLTATLAPDERAGYRLFVQPYRRANSHLSGPIDLEPHPTLAGRRYAPLGSSILVWRKVGVPTDTSYRNGIGPLDIAFRIDPWVAPTATLDLRNLLGLGPGSVMNVLHTGFTSAVFADLPSTLELLPSRKVIVTAPVTTPPNRTGWKMAINVVTGTFSGSFQLLDSVPAPTTANPAATRNITRKISFTGVLRQPHGTAGDPLTGAAPLLIPALPTAPTNELESATLTLLP